MTKRQETNLIPFSDWKSIRSLIPTFIIVAALIVGSSSLIPLANADVSAPEKVPAPWILENHEFNVSHIGGGELGGYYQHEGWGIQIMHGGSRTAIEVRNINNGPQPSNDTGVDYSNYLEYGVGGRRFGAQFLIVDLKFEVGGGNYISTTLSSCSDFILNRTPVKYDGAVPTFDCNISLYDIHVYSQPPYPAGSGSSTFDLTLIHHIRGDWNNTQIKLEALLNFSNTRFFSPTNSTEYPAGTKFTAEIDYRIYVSENINNQTTGFMMPTNRTDKALMFDLPQNNGTPLTVSRLDMRDNFTIHNATGDNASVGSSFMGVSNNVFTPVIHKFQNLTYRDTQWIRSDPKMTVYHDRVTEENNQNPWATGLGGANLVQIVAVCAAIAIGAIGAVLFLKRRRKKASEEAGKKPKET